MKILIDVMGGDDPTEVVKGALAAAEEHPDLSIVLTGDEKLIADTVAEKIPNLTVVGTSETISNDESPTMAIKTKKNSSMVVALRMLSQDDDAIGMVSTGSTGAVLTGASLIVGRIPGVYRPTLMSQLPTMNGSMVCITDSGANMDSRPEWLYQFAVMGSAYMKAVTGKDKPSVALLNVGTEDHKGNALIHETFPLLKNSALNFVGNMEARDTLTGKYDVVVCDGYDGNILLKGSEGTAKMVMNSLKAAIMGSFSAKIGYLFMKKAFKKLRHDMDYNNYGGAPFLGIKKPVIKSHGSSNASAIRQSVNQLLKIKEGNVIEMIKSGIAEGAK